MVHNWQFRISDKINSLYCSVVYMNMIDPFLHYKYRSIVQKRYGKAGKYKTKHGLNAWNCWYHLFHRWDDLNTLFELDFAPGKLP